MTYLAALALVAAAAAAVHQRGQIAEAIDRYICRLSNDLSEDDQ